MLDIVNVLGKPVNLTVTRRARKALEKQENGISVEMELLFSCMLRKRVLIREGRTEGSSPVTDKLHIFFHAVMTDRCNLSDYESLADIPVIDFPSHKLSQLVPRWLKLDHSSGKFKGDFGYTFI